MTCPTTAAISATYGGVFVAETLIAGARRAEARRTSAIATIPEFAAEFEYELKHYVGRPSPIYHAKRWSEQFGGAQIYLKREDLNHTGAHKINNTVGQALLARRMGKPRVIAETGAGSMASRPRRSRRASAWNASSTWARRTSSARRTTSTA